MSTTETERSFNVPASSDAVVVLRYVPASRDPAPQSGGNVAANKQHKDA